MAHAAENPMAIKRANDDTFEAQIDQARKGLTPRRAKRVSLAAAAVVVGGLVDGLTCVCM